MKDLDKLSSDEISWLRVMLGCYKFIGICSVVWVIAYCIQRAIQISETPAPLSICLIYENGTACKDSVAELDYETNPLDPGVPCWISKEFNQVTCRRIPARRLK